MKSKKARTTNVATKLWKAAGGLALFSLTVLILRELPSMRRELRLIRM